MIEPGSRLGTSPAPDLEGAPPPGRRRGLRLPSTFASLRHRNYRLLWFGTLVSSSGDWMDQIAFNWLVWELTHSPVWLAWANFARFLPILVFTLIGGVVADRVERRKLLFGTQSAAMVLAVALAVIVTAGIAQVWMVIAIAAGRGIMNSFNQPARQSLISELVPEDDLSNAIALNSATMNTTRVIGPAIGGLLIATVGMSGAFWINAATFVLLLGALAMMTFPNRTEARARTSVLADLVDGFQYLRHHPQLRLLVLLALVPILLGQPYVTMLPIFASDVLHIGGGGLGALNTASAVGAVAGSLGIASLRSGARLGWWMLVGLAGFGLALTLFALSTSLVLSIVALIVLGLLRQTYQAANNVLIQTNVDPAYRGRVLSTLTLDRGLAPAGTMMAALGSTVIGVQITMALMAGALVVLALAAGWAAPTLRTLEASSTRPMRRH